MTAPREGCPAWCTADDHPERRQHWTDRWPEDGHGRPTLVRLSQYPSDPRPWLWIVDVMINGPEDDPVIAADQAVRMAELMRRLGQEKIAAAVEELAALATGSAQ